MRRAGSARAYLFWYGIRLNLPFFRLYRLYVSYTDEQQGKALPWEDGSEQTIRDHAGWRFAAAAVLAALLLAAAYCAYCCRSARFTAGS